MELPSRWRRVQVSILAILSFLGIAQSSQVYPECTFESCSQCLLDIKTSTQNLSITGPDTLTYQAPLRIGRSPAYWDSQSLVAQMVGILVKEKLGFNIEYVACEDESKCTFGTCSCSGYNDDQCNPVTTKEQAELAVQEGTKLYADPLADIFIFTEDFEDNMNRESFEGTNMDFDSKSVVVIGPTGYTSLDGVFGTLRLYEEAWEKYLADTDSLRAFARAEVRNLTDKPIKLIEDGVEAEFLGCRGETGSVVEVMMQYHRDNNWTCNNDSWWVNPACAEYGEDWVTECLVLIEDDWGFPKPELYDYFPQSEVPVAKLMVGYDPWWELTYYEVYNVLFTWWSPDASFVSQGVRRVNLPYGVDISPSIALKVGYEAALQADDRLTAFLTAMTVDEYHMINLMDLTALAIEQGHSLEDGNATDSFYQKLACDWLRANEDWEEWLASANRCYSGEYFDNSSESCQDCPMGTRGAMSSDGDLYCQACEPGSYSQLGGHTLCSSCPKGSFMQESGATACEFCPRGTYSNATGQTACTVCEVGTAYPRTTDAQGSSSAADCRCGEGSYDGPEGGDCIACPEGMECEFGSSYSAFATWDASDPDSDPIPLVSPGYFTLKSEPLSVYLCDDAAGKEHCPGGGPETCGNGREGLVCARCPAGEAPTEDNACASCDAPLIYLGLLLVPAMLVALVVGIALLSKDSISQTHSSLLCIVSIGLLLTGLQSLGIFDQISVNWVHPVKALIRLGRLFSFNLNLLKTSCVLGSNPVVSYGFRLLLVPAVLPLIGLVTWLRHGREGLLPELVNNVGSCCNVVFISIVVSCFIPFVCYSHPSGAHWSIRSMPSILCFEGVDFVTMAILGIIAFLCIPLPFTAVAAYGSWSYPVLVKRHNSTVLLQALRFLFIKYNPRTFFYTPILLLRNLSISVVAVIFTQPATQILSLCVLIFLFTCIQVSLQPWRRSSLNLADASLSLLLQTVLVSGSMLSGVSATDEALTVVNVLMVFAFGVVAFGLFAWNLRTLYNGKRRKYSRFLCHHKACAAAQARLLKMYLTSRSQSVFIDSDDLDDLDSLFDIVKTKVLNLVVYLTRDTLRRPWCAGEITTAFKASKAKVLAVWTPSFCPPSHRDMEDLQTYVEEAGCPLKQYGIFWEDVFDSFKQLLDVDATPRIRLAHAPKLMADYTLLATSVLTGRSCELFLDSEKDLGSLASENGQVLVSADGTSDEASAAAGILVLKLRERLFLRDGSNVPVASLIEKKLEDLDELAACVSHSRAVIIMLSDGSLNNFLQLCVIIEATQQRGASMSSPPSRMVSAWRSSDRSGSGMGLQETRGVVPLMLSGFRFPTEEFYRQTLHRVVKDSTEEMRLRIRSFFNLIVMPFSTHLSNATLSMEVGKVLDRIPMSSPNQIHRVASPDSLMHHPTKGARQASVSERWSSSNSASLPVFREQSGASGLASKPIFREESGASGLASKPIFREESEVQAFASEHVFQQGESRAPAMASRLSALGRASLQKTSGASALASRLVVKEGPEVSSSVSRPAFKEGPEALSSPLAAASSSSILAFRDRDHLESAPILQEGSEATRYPELAGSREDDDGDEVRSQYSV